jgi:acetyl-CoA acetyltransferase
MKVFDSFLSVTIYSRYKIQKPIARIVGFEDAALDPVDWPIAPAVGIKALLSRFGLDATKDIHQWEINEAFAMVVIANLRILGLSENYKVTYVRFLVIRISSLMVVGGHLL